MTPSLCRSSLLYLLLILPLLTFLDSAQAATRGDGGVRCGGAEVTAFADEPVLRSKLSVGEQRRLKGLKTALIGDGFDSSGMDMLFSGPEIGLYDVVTRLFKDNPETKTDTGEVDYLWYKECLGGEKRYANAGSFISEHNLALKEAERKYGVDYRYIVSILGIESNFSRDRGRFKAVDALISLYLLVENKKRYGYTQLKELINYSNKTSISIHDLRSSYAGAIGCGQFIPSSLNNYFVGKAGRIEDADPFSTTDCIFSIAYYLKRSGWKRIYNKSTPGKGTGGWRAIRAYNHSDAYTRFVIEMAGGLERL